MKTLIFRCYVVHVLKMSLTVVY